MKKTLIALAVLASTSAALAQSSVSVYGRMDLSVGSLDTSLSASGETQMFSGNLTTSRLGFRGTEDLGGGLKANFRLEQAITATSGAGGTFNRASWVGLSGGFGSLALGKNDSSFKDIYDLGVKHNVFDSEFTPVKVAYGGVGNFASRPDSLVRYDAPKMGGFSAGVSYGFDQTLGTNSDITAFNLRYAAGPLDIGLGFQNEATTTTDKEYTVLSAAYNFGAFRVSSHIHNAKQGTQKDNDLSIGVSIPVGAFDFSVGYATSTTKVAGVKTVKGSGFGLGATYALSKRTQLYGGYLDGDREDGANTKTATRTLYAVGIRHDF